MQGYVRKLFQDKGFAFIEGEDQRDYFLHWSKVLRSSVPFRNMVENDVVSFDVEEGNQGPKALNVLVIRKVNNNGSDRTETQAHEIAREPFNAPHSQDQNG